MENDELLSCMGVLFLVSVMLIISAMADGFVLSVLWRWFAVPLFGAPALNLWQAIGLSLISAVAANGVTVSDTDEIGVSDVFKVLALIVARSLFLLSVGWMAKVLAF